MSETMQTKDNIRKQIRKWRSELTPDWITTRSRDIVKRFRDLDEFQTAETVCLYMAIAGEPRLDAVIQDCWKMGRRVLVPAYRKEFDDYGYKALEEDTDIIVGLWNVPEPNTNEWNVVDSSKTCIVVPGVAFDDAGRRVGHGKGYYDRLLAFTKDITSCTKVGVCFDFQRVTTLPHEEWDIEMDIILSESRITRG